MSLADLFIPHLAPELRGDAIAPALEPLLAELLARSRRAWPEVQLADAAFLRFLAERLPADRPLAAVLAETRSDDLYLVCACLGGDAAAQAIFERRFLPETEVAVARMRSAAARADDVRQILCQKLLVGDGEHPPKLARYSGHGDLVSWLRVTAMRTALDLMRSEKRTEQLDDNALFEHLASPGSDQELQFLKQHYRNEFRAAFHETLAALSTRERNVLKLQLLDGLNIDQVGALFQVHRATVARWNQKVREKLLKTTRRALLERLHINRTEFESIMRLIQSQFDVSICRYLDEEKPGGGQ